mmetsp:Transcript_90716/g.239983  ORF Transcript_90716/g.239983 Transcript_90716/m.239983 type:complete len:270 (+) Transcript_90716:1102-1911(+)
MRRGPHGRDLVHVPPRRARRPGRLPAHRGLRPHGGGHHAGPHVHLYAHADHHRLLQGDRHLHPHHAHPVDGPPLHRRHAHERRAEPRCGRVWRSPLQRERILPGAAVAPVRLPARHLPHRASQDEGAARAGGEGPQGRQGRRPHARGRHDALALRADVPPDGRPRVDRSALWPHRGVCHGRAHADGQPGRAAVVARRAVVRLGVRADHLQALRARHPDAGPLQLPAWLGPAGPAGDLVFGHVRLPPRGRHVVGRAPSGGGRGAARAADP